LLLPLVFPAFLLSGLVDWLTGNAAKRAALARAGHLLSPHESGPFGRSDGGALPDNTS
jgi:hypothetical protein